jgi:hypothetical protein
LLPRLRGGALSLLILLQCLQDCTGRRKAPPESD